MKILELFAGSRSIGKAAEKLGHEVFSVDWTAYEGIDLVKDISDLQIDDLPWIPDMIWAAPDCTTYSIAAISHHRNGTIPTSDYAKKCDGVNVHVMFLINRLLDHNKDLKWFIENPRGMMRKMPWMIGLPRVTIWYCTYGDDRAKPTDIWSNHIYSLFNTDGWNPKPPCHNDNEHCHHEKAPRGSKTGTQGLSGSYERSMYPKQLCIDVINSVNKTI
jgi:site-specific DNA-cytosine methylase